MKNRFADSRRIGSFCFLSVSVLYFTASRITCKSQVAGGYNPTAISTDVREAAAFAVRQQGKKETAPLKLIAVSRAKKQIVAGSNYALSLRVMKGKETHSAEVIVFQSLAAHYQLTAWQWVSPPKRIKKH